MGETSWRQSSSSVHTPLWNDAQVGLEYVGMKTRTKDPSLGAECIGSHLGPPVVHGYGSFIGGIVVYSPGP